jgi:predicted ATPase
LSIGKCTLVAVEGAHGAGKTTLVLAVTASLKWRGVNAIALAEVTRSSPFVEETAIFGGRPYSISSQLQLFGTQLAKEQLLARHHEVVVCDRSILNPIAYGRLLLSDPRSKDVLAALEIFARAYAGTYDAIFFVRDNRLLLGSRDPYRPTDEDFRRRADDSLQREIADSGVVSFDVPEGLELPERTSWVISRIPMT